MQKIQILILLSLLCGFSSQVLSAGQNVKVTSIKREHTQLKVRTFGVLAPSVEEISFQIPGRISKFSIDEGDRVEAGQLLAKMQTENAEGLLRKAEIQFDNVGRILKRMEALHSAGSIQTSQLEDVQGRFNQVRIEYDQAKARLAHCFLRAPSKGLILKQYVNSRTSVQAGRPIFIFQSDDEQWVIKVDLTDKNALIMSDGATANVYFSPYPNDIFSGIVSKVARVANLTDGLYTAEIIISTQGKELRPGMVAEVDLIKDSDRPYSIVPFDALLDLRKIRGHIYVVSEDGHKATELAVTINAINQGFVSLEEDLSQYDQVITHGHQGLNDQSDINIQVKGK